MIELLRSEIVTGLGLVLAGLSDSIGGWLLDLIARTC